jgi:hypothetical protein
MKLLGWPNSEKIEFFTPSCFNELRQWFCSGGNYKKHREFIFKCR